MLLPAQPLLVLQREWQLAEWPELVAPAVSGYVMATWAKMLLVVVPLAVVVLGVESPEMLLATQYP